MSILELIFLPVILAVYSLQKRLGRSLGGNAIIDRIVSEPRVQQQECKTASDLLLSALKKTAVIKDDTRNS